MECFRSSNDVYLGQALGCIESRNWAIEMDDWVMSAFSFLRSTKFYHINCTRSTIGRSDINFNYHQALTPRFAGLMYNVQYPLYWLCSKNAKQVIHNGCPGRASLYTCKIRLRHQDLKVMYPLRISEKEE